MKIILLIIALSLFPLPAYGSDWLTEQLSNQNQRLEENLRQSRERQDSWERQRNARDLDRAIQNNDRQEMKRVQQRMEQSD